MKYRLVQISAGANPGDAITNDMILIDHYFKNIDPLNNFSDTCIYANSIGSGISVPIHSLTKYTPKSNDILFIHYSTGLPTLNRILNNNNLAFLIYHNITPAHFYEPWSLQIAGELKRARTQLIKFSDRFKACFADSKTNAIELKNYGFSNINIRPVFIPLLNRQQSLKIKLPDSPLTNFKFINKEDKILLFTGRITPNKGHVTLLKIFAILLRLNPNTKLILAGGLQYAIPRYLTSLTNLIQALGIYKRVVFTNFISDSDLKQLYKRADIFTCFSEHEGFCVPLLEAMFYQLPVVALDCPESAVKNTMQNSGVIISKQALGNKNDYFRIALLINKILSDSNLAKAIVEKQNNRLHDYKINKIKQQLSTVLSKYI